MRLLLAATCLLLASRVMPAQVAAPSGPAVDNLAGMWRLVIDGKATLYELLTITRETDAVVLRLRHFDRAGVGWEDRDHPLVLPLVLPLVQQREREAVFEGPGSDGFLRITYRRVSDDTLESIVEEGPSASSAKRETFRFRRRPL